MHGTVNNKNIKYQDVHTLVRYERINFCFYPMNTDHSLTRLMRASSVKSLVAVIAQNLQTNIPYKYKCQNK